MDNVDELAQRLALELLSLKEKGYDWTPRWVAQDANGEWEAYQYEPELIKRDSGGFWNNQLPAGESGLAEHAVLFIDQRDTSNWKHTLIKLD